MVKMVKMQGSRLQSHWRAAWLIDEVTLNAASDQDQGQGSPGGIQLLTLAPQSASGHMARAPQSTVATVTTVAMAAL